MVWGHHQPPALTRLPADKSDAAAKHQGLTLKKEVNAVVIVVTGVRLKCFGATVNWRHSATQLKGFCCSFNDTGWLLSLTFIFWGGSLKMSKSQLIHQLQQIKNVM